MQTVGFIGGLTVFTARQRTKNAQCCCHRGANPQQLRWPKATLCCDIYSRAVLAATVVYAGAPVRCGLYRDCPLLGADCRTEQDDLRRLHPADNRGIETNSNQLPSNFRRTMARCGTVSPLRRTGSKRHWRMARIAASSNTSAGLELRTSTSSTAPLV